MTTRSMLVFGATGRVGGQVVAQLAGAGHAVRALTRDPAAARGLPSGVEVVAGAPGDPDGLGPALEGVDTVFLAFPSLVDDGHAGELVKRLAVSVPRIVYLSAHGVPDEPAQEPGEPDGTILGSHRHLEALIAGSGVEWTFLRPSGFAANTLGWAEQLRRGDELRWYVGDAVRAPIHEADIAAVAVRALVEDGWHRARPHLTGPEQLTQRQQLARLGRALGRELRFVELDADTARAELYPDAPAGFVHGIVDAHTDFITHPEQVTDEVAALTGRPARTYQQWATDHADDFGREDGGTR